MGTATRYNTAHTTILRRSFAFLIHLALLAAPLALFTLAGCSVDSAPTHEEPVETAPVAPVPPPIAPETVSIIVEVDFPAAAAALTDPLFNAATIVDINTVTVEAYQPFPVSVGFADMVRKPGTVGTWSGLLVDLPVGVPLDFEILALDVSAFVIFEGFTEGVVLTGSEDPTTPSESVSITPVPVPTDEPIINGITMDGCPLPISQCPIPLGGSKTVRIHVEGRPVGASLSPDELTIEFVNDDPIGAFAPNSKLLILEESGQPAAIPGFTYSVPTSIISSPDFRAQKVRVTNKRGFFVEQSFNLQIVNSTGIGINFAPVIQSVSASREVGTGNVTWTATASDDREDPATELSYVWSFAQTAGDFFVATFDPGLGGVNDQNPGLLVDYDQTVEGTLTITVTDFGSDGVPGNGDELSSTATFSISAGQIPDDL